MPYFSDNNNNKKIKVPILIFLFIPIDCTIQNVRLWGGYSPYNKDTFPNDIRDNENWIEESIESSNTKKMETEIIWIIRTKIPKQTGIEFNNYTKFLIQNVYKVL